LTWQQNRIYNVADTSENIKRSNYAQATDRKRKKESKAKKEKVIKEGTETETKGKERLVKETSRDDLPAEQLKCDHELAGFRAAEY
jgi:hypothetical protein